jgi:hypothetical protein
MKTKAFNLKGVSPLLMHNVRLANPGDAVAMELKKVSAKQKKTDSDYTRMSDIEFRGGLYLNGDLRIIIPAKCIEAAIYEAAGKIIRSGKKLFKSSVFVFEDSILGYDGPKDPEKLAEDQRFYSVEPVVIQRKRIMRTRPIFRTWTAETVVTFFPESVNESQVNDAIEYAGRMVGLCDWRPRYGRFELSD